MGVYYLKVYAAFWSRHSESIVEGSVKIIREKLDSSLRYTAVHKRNIEGDCNRALIVAITKALYDPSELPMSSPLWSGDLEKMHPLCQMPLSFVQETQNMHSRNGSKIFVAWDGQGSVDDYLAVEGKIAAFSKSENTPSNDKYSNANVTKWLEEGDWGHPLQTRSLFKHIDMFLAIHADFFVLNPRSTYSWMIFVVRVALGLESVPVLRHQDVYLNPHYKQHNNKMLTNPLWVSFAQIVEAYYLVV